MTHDWNEFTKLLVAESAPRRESLRQLGLVFAGAVLAPLVPARSSVGILTAAVGVTTSVPRLRASV